MNIFHNKKIKLKGNLYLLGNKKYFFQNSNKRLILNGDVLTHLLFKVLRYLNGDSNIEEIGKNFSRDEFIIINVILHRLYDYGFIETIEAPPEEFSQKERKLYIENIDFFSQFRKDRYIPQKYLKKAKILLIGQGKVGQETLKSLIEIGIGQIGFTITDLDNGTYKALNSEIKLKKFEFPNNYVDVLKLTKSYHLDLIIVVGDFLEPLIYNWINKVCIEKRIKWTRAVLDGHYGKIGPSICPFSTPCYTCYNLRKITNEESEMEEIENIGEIERVRLIKGEKAYFPFAKILAHYLILEVMKILTGIMPPLTFGIEFRIDLLSMKFSSHHIFKLPRCPSCGVNDEV
jgi:bacteriocin biosynthesis cyclodehydratase domain-containing protein